MAILGTATIMIMACFKTQELFVENIFEIPTVLIQMILALLGSQLMAAVLPTRLFTVPGTESTFSLNPDPFNQKEHTLIGVCAYIGLISPNLIQSVATTKKLSWHKSIPPSGIHDDLIV